MRPGNLSIGRTAASALSRTQVSISRNCASFSTTVLSHAGKRTAVSSAATASAKSPEQEQRLPEADVKPHVVSAIGDGLRSHLTLSVKRRRWK